MYGDNEVEDDLQEWR